MWSFHCLTIKTLHRYWAAWVFVLFKVKCKMSEGELINTPGNCLVSASVSTCLEGPGFHDERKSCEPRWCYNYTASLSPTAPWSLPGSTSEIHTHTKSGDQPSFELYKNLSLWITSVCTVSCCMISCSRAALASSWLWSGVCCSSIDRICPSCGSSSSLRSPTHNNCRTILSRRGTVLSADTQAPQIASLHMSHKGFFKPKCCKSLSQWQTKELVLSKVKIHINRR